MIKIRWLFASVGFLLLSAGGSHATCFNTNFKLERDDNKEKIIDQILEYGRCVKAEQRKRVGKYFCYVDSTVGIQVDKQKQVFSGKIKSDPHKFFVTIKELDDDEKRTQCDWGVYGLSNDLDESYGNNCLANYDIEFSPEMGVFKRSADTIFFYGWLGGSFRLYDDKKFVLFQAQGSNNNYLSQGLCEKIN